MACEACPFDTLRITGRAALNLLSELFHHLLLLTTAGKKTNVHSWYLIKSDNFDEFDTSRGVSAIPTSYVPDKISRLGVQGCWRAQGGTRIVSEED